MSHPQREKEKLIDAHTFVLFSRKVDVLTHNILESRPSLVLTGEKISVYCEKTFTIYNPAQREKSKLTGKK